MGNPRDRLVWEHEGLSVCAFKQVSVSCKRLIIVFSLTLSSDSQFRVNSREVRRVVEDIIEESEVKPSTIRFFRGAMFNMVCPSPGITAKFLDDYSHLCIFCLIKINIALSEIDVTAKPSRCTFALAQWIEERNREVYPKMKG